MHKTNGITVRELLNLEILKDSQVLSGSGGLDHRIFKMNVMEVPDILDWVRAGEFLLTTAYSIRETPERLKGLVEALSAKGWQAWASRPAASSRRFPRMPWPSAKH